MWAGVKDSWGRVPDRRASSCVWGTWVEVGLGKKLSPSLVRLPLHCSVAAERVHAVDQHHHA